MGYVGYRLQWEDNHMSWQMLGNSWACYVIAQLLGPILTATNVDWIMVKDWQQSAHARALLRRADNA